MGEMVSSEMRWKREEKVIDKTKVKTGINYTSDERVVEV